MEDAMSGKRWAAMGIAAVLVVVLVWSVAFTIMVNCWIDLRAEGIGGWEALAACG